MLDVTVNLPGETITTKAAAGENLLHVLRSAGVKLDAPCNGNGTCGKCRVKLEKGRVRQQCRGRQESAGSGELVLACSCTVTEPLVVTVPRETLLACGSICLEQDSSSFAERYYKIKKAFEALHGRESHLHTAVVPLDEPTLDDNLSDVARLNRHLRLALGSEAVISVDLARKLPHVTRENGFQVAALYSCLPDGKIRLHDVKAPQGRPAYGIAVDVGTTSVAACLVDLENGRILGEGACANAQSRYGADVINRIIFATKGDGLQLLQSAVVQESINPLIRELCLHSGLCGDDIVLFSVAANTVMTHLLLGIWPDYLRKEPYIPALTDTESIAVTAADLGLCINRNALILLAPSVASYVGGDITAGVAAAFLRETEQNSMLIDLGTNGEIVLGNREFAMACACSAGPAFEGGEISCGMRAAAGAIEGVTIDSTYTAHLQVIGGQKPAGICGSGLIDLIAELKRTGLIDARGRFRKEKKTANVVYDAYGVGRYIVAARERYGIPADIYLTEIDIDNFIRAKAAVYSAACVLLSSLGLDFDDLAEIKVAGGIGNHINLANAVQIGLFPALNPDKFTFIGNSSLTGSYLSLINKKATAFINQTAQQMTYLELSVYPGYMDEFVSASFIPHTDRQRFPSAAPVLP